MFETTMDRRGIEASAAAMEAVFAGYSRTLAWAPEIFARNAVTNDVNLERSPLWYDDDGTVVAAALLAFRGDRAWVGGFGVAPDFRGRGLATKLIADLISRARAENARDLSLEVLVENAGALATYDRAGFSRTRKLLTFVHSGQRTSDPLPEYDIEIAYAARLADQPCWQHASESLAHVKSGLHSIGEAESFIVYSRNNERRRVSTFKTNAHDARALDRLASAACGCEGFDEISLFNEPADGLAARAACELGWAIDATQYEMHLTLA